MDAKEKEFLLSELIGEHVLVAKASSKGVQGFEGRIVDETRNTFLIQGTKGRKVIPKAGNSFAFGSVLVQGKLLVCRPEDRTKVLSKKLK